MVSWEKYCRDNYWDVCCPICGTETPPELSDYSPFCSSRCQGEYLERLAGEIQFYASMAAYYEGQNS